MDIHTACFQYCTSKAIRPSTIKSYKNVVRTFVGNTGITGLEQITPELLTEWKNVVAKRSSAATFNNYYRHLSALFNYCVKKKLLTLTGVHRPYRLALQEICRILPCDVLPGRVTFSSMGSDSAVRPRFR